ncbi:rhombosortase [Marinobacter salinexigens]|uniref:Rhombosortase n=1 Tax=Marinobacter salinexigens TaxID=2919747 RepID=A0A5B0VF91_9GAMM|nr:rhombosortase [Marinobacter salinexigens]KAA1172883.1 rhombosortase [Marinobacter salinexigens]
MSLCHIVNGCRKFNVREFGLPLLLGASLILAWWFRDVAADVMMYRRSGIEAGQIWRLLTAHWVHLSVQHLALNLTTLAITWWFFGHALAGLAGYILTLFISMGLSLTLLLLNSDVEWYVGFSGVLHGLLIAGALLSRRHNPLLSALVVLVVVIKLAFEQILGPNPDLVQFIGSPVLVEAHLYGAVLGFLSAAVMARLQ